MKNKKKGQIKHILLFFSFVGCGNLSNASFPGCPKRQTGKLTHPVHI
jgi:hypothetical protein